MSKIEFSPLEKEMANFNFDELETHTQKSKAMMMEKTVTAADIKSQICGVWSRIRKYVVLATNIPFIGKFISVLVDLLDTICGQ